MMLAIVILAVFYGKVVGEEIPKLVAQTNRQPMSEDMQIGSFGHGKQWWKYNYTPFNESNILGDTIIAFHNFLICRFTLQGDQHFP